MKVNYVLKALIKKLTAMMKTNHMLSLIPFCRADKVFNDDSSWIESTVLSVISISNVDSSGIIMAVIVLAAAGYFALTPPHRH